MNVIEEVKKLGFPANQYIVVGGAVMSLHGIRTTEDLDILTMPNLFEACKQEGWEVKSWTKPGKKGKEWLKKGNTELYTEILMAGDNIPTETLIKEVEEVKGVPCIPLSRLVEFKEEYLRLYNRPKDAQDIALIKNYLASR